MGRSFQPAYVRLGVAGLRRRAEAAVAALAALLKVDPLFDELRAEPRFQALLERLKFPDQ